MFLNSPYGAKGVALPKFSEERIRALIAGDGSALEALLHDELHYVHATGIKHGKTEYLEFVRNGIRILSIEFLNVVVAELTDAVVVSGLLHQKIVRKGMSDAVDVTSWVTEVWVRGAQWKLLSFQSTRKSDD